MPSLPADITTALMSCNAWRPYLATLAKATGFTLSVLSRKGDVLYSTSEIHPPCEAVQASPGVQQRCDASCHESLADSLNSHVAKIFKCGAKIIVFLLPFECGGVKAAVLGQGSFSRYDDLRALTHASSFYTVEPSVLTMPPTFTSEGQAQNVCSLLKNYLSHLRRSSRENVHLQKRLDSLRSMLEGWTPSVQVDAIEPYRTLSDGLSAFIAARDLSVLVTDPRRKAYVGIIQPRKSRKDQPLSYVSWKEPFLQLLSSGQQHVSVTGAGGIECLVFPVLVNGRIEGLVSVAGAALTESDARTISAFCRHASLVIENNRHHRDICRKFDRLASVAAFTEAMASVHNAHALVQRVLEKSADLLLAEQGSLMLLDQVADSLLMEAVKGTVAADKAGIRVPLGAGIAGKVAELGEPLLVENVESDPRVGKKNEARYKTPSFLSVPIKVEKRIMGVLNLADKVNGEVFNEEDLQLVQALAAHAAVLLERNALTLQLDKLKKLSITDPLTGLLNRRYLHDRLEEELTRSRRFSRPLSLLMVDLDGFKQVNDEFGHSVGDGVLKAIAEVIMHSVRAMDIVARYGGDEFMIILPETGPGMAHVIAERLRCDISTAQLPAGAVEVNRRTITASIGIACYPEQDAPANCLLEFADVALYRAKTIGKNRIEAYS